jgi:hypothetical protein
LPKSVRFTNAVDQWAAENLNIKLKTAPSSSAIRDAIANFAIMDEKAYRFEADRELPVAFACMNNREFSNKLLGIYDMLKRAA